jgi:hypothetical protein
MPLPKPRNKIRPKFSSSGRVDIRPERCVGVEMKSSVTVMMMSGDRNNAVLLFLLPAYYSY